MLLDFFRSNDGIFEFAESNEYYHDSCHEQEGCRIQHVLVSISENHTRVYVDTNSYSIFLFA